MVLYTCTVYRYYGEDGYKKSMTIAKFYVEAVDYDLAQELADSMVQGMPDVFVISEET